MTARRPIPHPTPGKGGVCALMVIYRPRRSMLLRALERLAPQVDRVLLVDNGAAPETIGEALRRFDNCRWLPGNGNPGVGAAQNRGLRHAFQRGYTHCLLMDQDSVAAGNMVASLLECSAVASGEGQATVVGPRILDARTGISLPFVTFGRAFIRRHRCSPADGPSMVPTDFLIASGTLIPRKAWERVGEMEARLFIDNVDLEWCFRARSRGIRLYGCCRTHLEHLLGDRVVRLPVGPGITVHRHAPLRQYYIIRNRLLLYRRPYTPRGWRLQDGVRVVLKTAFLLAFFPQRRRNLRMVVLGIRDGLRGRSGRCPHPDVQRSHP